MKKICSILAAMALMTQMIVPSFAEEWLYSETGYVFSTVQAIINTNSAPTTAQDIQGHLELVNVPIATFGHSNGNKFRAGLAAWMPERVPIARNGIYRQNIPVCGKLDETDFSRSSRFSVNFVR